MDFDIIEEFYTTLQTDATSDLNAISELEAKVDPLHNLLVESKGYPIEKKQDIKLFKGLWQLNFLPKAQTVLGAIYWLPKCEIMTPSDKLKDSRSVLLLEPLAMPGQWASTIKLFYNHSSRPDIIGVPRFWGLSEFGPAEKDIRTLGMPLSQCTEISLRDIQKRAVEQTLCTLQQWGGATIIADCGFGKTRLALSIISRLGRRAIILCNRDILMLQWASVINELMPGLKVSWFQGSQNLRKSTVKTSDGRVFAGPLESSDICILSIETLIEGHGPKDFLQTFGTVVVDECHHLAASTLVHALPLMPARNIVGLSATPDRRDGLEHALYWLSGPVSFVYKRLPSITGLSEQVEVLKLVFDEGLKREKFYQGGQMAFAEMITFLTQDASRNKLILDQITDLVSKRAKLIVVSSMVQHCMDLYEAIQNSSASELKNVQMALMAGSNVQSGLAKEPKTRIVFATYSLLEEGYDDQILDTLLLVTPRSRIQQTVGRIERTHDNKLRPLVIDIVDNFSVYPSMWAKRKKFYSSRGFLIH